MRSCKLIFALVLILAGCTAPEPQAPVSDADAAGAAEVEPMLTFNDWVLRQIDGQDLDPALSAAITESISLRIDQQHMDESTAQLSGFDGCNRYFASVELTPGGLKVGNIGASKMYCEASSAFAQRYQQRLRQVSRYAIAGRELQLSDSQGQVLLSYRLP